MTVYLIHFDRPFRHARHYIGYSADEATLPRRLAHHRNGTGATLMRHVSAAGIDWKVVRTWPGKGRLFERNLKQHSGTRYCPICNPAALSRKAAWPTEEPMPDETPAETEMHAAIKAANDAFRRGDETDCEAWQEHVRVLCDTFPHLTPIAHAAGIYGGGPA